MLTSNERQFLTDLLRVKQQSFYRMIELNNKDNEQNPYLTKDNKQSYEDKIKYIDKLIDKLFMERI